ncbi:MAG TPA: VWA domain-containing protein [Candidatus Sulfotelmatobacter sp.]|nr:VWA domain-containing protein [Candidatus Sulfotelmatobacter sp.]
MNTPAVRVSSRLVLVDAVVTDKSGQRITGLTKDDFTILENGKPQKISAFSFETPEAPSPRPALPPNVYTNRPEYDMPKGPLTILLLDGLNTAVADQGFARSQMLKYLGSQLQPGQPVAVYTLAGSLRLLQDFTGDTALLKAAVEHFNPQTSVEMQVENVTSVMPNLHITGDTGARGGSSADSLRLVFIRMSEFMNEQAKLALQDRVYRTAAALRLIAHRMGGYPGRKNLIWVSAGFPIDITSEVVQMTTDVDVLAQANTAAAPQLRVEESFEELLRQLAAELTDAQMSVYSVDARGLVGSTLADASRQGTNEVGMLQTGAEYGARVARANTAVQASQDTLLTLASESGGMFFKTGNDVAGAVRSSVADGSAYYMLGYVPDAKDWDGKFRKIQVKVNKPGCELRYRMGYYAKDPMKWDKSKAKNDPDLASAMSLGSPLSTMVVFDSRVIPPPPAPRVKLPVEFLVNPRTIAGEEMKDGGRHFGLEFHVAAYSPDGKLITHVDTGMDAPVKADRLQVYLQQGIPFKADLDMPPGEYRLRLAVRDTHTGFIGTTEIPLKLSAK